LWAELLLRDGAAAMTELGIDGTVRHTSLCSWCKYSHVCSSEAVFLRNDYRVSDDELIQKEGCWFSQGQSAELIVVENTPTVRVGFRAIFVLKPEHLPRQARDKHRDCSKRGAIFFFSQAHNLVVCTLCSCYASALLGWPPDWFKSRSYRARAVREPRSVLAEFGLPLGDDVSVAVCTCIHRR
jgi:hypothetical protein